MLSTLLLALIAPALADDPTPLVSGGTVQNDAPAEKKEGEHCEMKDGKCCNEHCKEHHPDGAAEHAEAKEHDCAGGACAHKKEFDLRDYVEPVALLQVWGTAMDQDTDAQADATGYGDPEDDPGIKLKRLRLGIKGHAKALHWRFVLGTDAPYDGLETPDEGVGIEDAEVGFEPMKDIGLEVGKGKIPFSRDQMMSAGDLTFTERGIAGEHIAPDRSLGASIYASRWGGKIQVGVYNSGGTLFGDDNPGKTYAGRLEYTLGKADPYKFYGGAEKKEFALGIGASGFLTNDVSTDTSGVGADLMVRALGISVMVDAAMSSLTPTNTTVASPEVVGDTDRQGITAQISYALGPIEPAVRYTAFKDSGLGDYSQFLGGLAVHCADDHVRVGAAYVLRMEGQSPVENDTVRLWAQFKL